ncbi:glycosyltransferase family 4 protein [Patescibacteria group bacterium]|nr:glycosyltransferase family 4 protein [Patescibacteria group bacterium]
MQNILFIINGFIKHNGQIGVSGGDVRLFAIIKHLPSGYKRHILTASNGQEMFKKYDIKIDHKHIINYTVVPGAKSFFIISLLSLFKLPPSLKNYHGLIYSSCEHLYDIFPALILKIFNKCPWYAVYHWVEDYPWREPRGGTPLITLYLYWFNRFVAGLLIKYFADRILAVSDQTKQKLIKMKKINSRQIKSVYCGVDLDQIDSIVSKFKHQKESKYDAVFMKRLNYGKGVLDLLQIWQKVCQTKPDAKLAIIGDGPSDVVQKIKDFIKNHKLQPNIKLLGVIYDFKEKFQVLNSSRLFILPSHEENWAIVIGEAMAAKLPVIAYNLKEIKPIWKDNVVWIDFADTNQFATTILEYLNSQSNRSKLTNKAYKFIQQYDWKKIAGHELE